MNSVLLQNSTVVEATGLVRRYGQGETCVNALRGVDLGIATGQLTAVMGPSGSGKSTLMHILAGLDRPTEGSVTIAGQDITQLSDNDLTLLRREHIGFIFQFFNLLPMLTAAENVVLPLSLAGRKPDARVGAASSPSRSASATASATARPSSPAASSSASRSPARSSRGRRSCSPTSRPATSTRAPAARSSTLLRSMVSDLGQTTVMVTHDAHAAAIADRVLFLADGEIVRDLGPSDAHTILETLEAGHGAMIKVALKGLAGRKVRALLTALAVVIGVSMVSGTFVLTDTMQKAFDGIFEESYEGTDAVVNGKQLVEFSTGGRATVPASLLKEGRGAPRPSTRPRAPCRTCRATPTPPSCSTARARSSAAQGETMGVGIDDAGRQFSPLKLKQGDWAHGDDEIVLDAGTASKYGFAVGDTIKAAATGPAQPYKVTGIATYGSVDSLGGASLAIFDLPTAQTLFEQGRRRTTASPSRPPTAPRRSALTQGDQAAAAQDRRRQDRRRPGRGRLQGHQREPEVHHVLPARLRRHRAVRRRVRDPQHALDHRRPALA